jgi:hypothetical protein
MPTISVSVAAAIALASKVIPVVRYPERISPRFSPGSWQFSGQRLFLNGLCGPVELVAVFG